MAGLDPTIHVGATKKVDHRVKPSDDNLVPVSTVAV
jgi:hypothetical protein